MDAWFRSHRTRPESAVDPADASTRAPRREGVNRQTTLLAVVGFLLSVTFACGLVIAVAHVVNKSFVALV